MGIRDEILSRLGLQRIDATAAPTLTQANIDAIGASAAAQEAWVNIYTSLGMGSHDPTVSMGYVARPLLTDRQREDLYGHGGVARTLIDKVVDDASRNGFELAVNAEGDTDIREAGQVGDSITEYLENIPVTINRLEVKSGALLALNRATKWARLYGGGAILLGLDDGQTQDQPLQESTLRGLSFIRVVTRKHIDAATFHRDPTQPEFGTTELWRVQTLNAEVGSATQLWHSDRVIPINGEEMPDGAESQGRAGWGLSTYDRGIAELRGAQTGEQTGDALVTRATLFALGRKGNEGSIQAGKESSVQSRVAALMRTMSTLRAIVYDLNREQISNLTFDVKGVVEFLDRNPFRVASAFGYPVSLVYSIQEGGLNTGALTGDISNYQNSFVKAQVQEATWNSPMRRLIHLAQISSEGPTNGQEFAVLLKWRPLSEPTAKEQAETRKIQAETDKIYLENLVVRIAEIRNSRFGGREYSADTVIEGPPPALELPANGNGPPDDEPEPSDSDNEEEEMQPSDTSEGEGDGEDQAQDE